MPQKVGCAGAIRLVTAVIKFRNKERNVRTKKVQTNRQIYTNFENNLARMAIYLPVKFEFDWRKCF